jgi:hypothetical protein
MTDLASVDGRGRPLLRGNQNVIPKPLRFGIRTT